MKLKVGDVVNATALRGAGALVRGSNWFDFSGRATVVDSFGWRGSGDEKEQVVTLEFPPRRFTTFVVNGDFELEKVETL